MPTAEQLLAEGQPAEALKLLQQQVRGHAADVRLRIFLFQLLAVLGQWPRALQQLKVCGELDAGTLAMVNTYTPALQCEAVRGAVFAGRTSPHIFGPPAPWVALLAQALQLDAAGHAAQATGARAAALEQAPASTGTLNDRPFEWIADADARLGPVLEVIINGRYGWLPFVHLRELSVEPVADLRDLIWAPAHLTFSNGGDSVALLPVRYAGSTEAADATLQLARKTEWLALAEGQYRGLGQRVLATDADELPLLEVRRIVLDPAADAPVDAASAAA
jgi:type VI secretion system protein ImpE